MKFQFKSYPFFKMFYPVFDGEDPTPPANPPADPPPTGGTDKVFTQDDLNRMLKKDREKHQEQTKKALDELEMLKKRSNLTDKERKQLDGRISQLQDELLTKEQLSAKEKDKMKADYEAKLKLTEEEREDYKGRYTELLIRRQILDAALEHDAFAPDQIVKMLRPDTQLIEELNEAGEPTGNLVPQVTLADVDKDGKPFDGKLAPSQAVKRMKEMEHYQNLFKGDGIGGVGGTNRGGGKKLDSDNLAKTDIGAYIEGRKKGTIKP